MNRMSVSRLVNMSAAKIHYLYHNPEKDRPFKGIHKSVADEGRGSAKLMCLSAMATYKDKSYYFTVDEVTFEEDVIICNIKKTSQEQSKIDHFKKTLTYVGVLAAMFELSDKKLCTVKRLVDEGYKFNKVEAADLACVFVLEYNGKKYDVVPDMDACLEWAHAKMQAVGTGPAAVTFDLLPFPEVEYYEIN